MAGVVALAIVASTVTVVGAAAGETTVNLATHDDRIPTGWTTTYDVVVETADGGVGAYELRLALDNANVGSIVDVQAHGEPDWEDIDIASNRSRASVAVAGADTDQSGRVTVVSVTVRGERPGSTGLDLVVDAIGDEQGSGYDVDAVNGAELSVYRYDASEPDEASEDSASADASDDGQSDEEASTVETTERTDETSPATTDRETTVTEQAPDDTTTEAPSSASDANDSQADLSAVFLVVAVLVALAAGLAVALKRR